MRQCHEQALQASYFKIFFFAGQEQPSLPPRAPFFDIIFENEMETS